MTTQVLFVQGGGGANVHDEWDSKLVESLGRELGPDYEIRYPRMPDEDDPKFARWAQTLRREIDKLDDGAVLVGHSIGATILVHCLAEEPSKAPLAGIFLMSMPFIGKDGWPNDEIRSEPDLGAKLPAQSPVYLYQGSADETVPAAHVDLNAKAIPQAVVRSVWTWASRPTQPGATTCPRWLRTFARWAIGESRHPNVGVQRRAQRVHGAMTAAASTPRPSSLGRPCNASEAHSHSIVAGGLLETS